MNELHVIGADRDHPLASLTVPAVSTNYKNDPGFVVLKVSPDSLAVEDYAVHTLAYPAGDGAAPPPAWKVEYAFDRAYGQSSFSGASVLKVLHQLHEEPVLRERYIDRFSSGSRLRNVVFQEWNVYACSMSAFDAAHFEKCYCR
jgi:hypothetical protein